MNQLGALVGGGGGDDAGAAADGAMV